MFVFEHYLHKNNKYDNFTEIYLALLCSINRNDLAWTEKRCDLNLEPFKISHEYFVGGV